MSNDIHVNLQFQIIEPNAVFNVTAANDYSIMLKMTELVLFNHAINGRDYIREGSDAKKTNMLVGSITIAHTTPFAYLESR
jgi:hypothetical protein